MREAEIQHKRICFQLIWDTHGLIRVLLDHLGQAFCLLWAVLFLSADTLLREMPGKCKCRNLQQDFQRPGPSGTVDETIPELLYSTIFLSPLINPVTLQTPH